MLGLGLGLWRGGGSAIFPWYAGYFMLMETADFLLQEDGTSKIILD